MEKEKKNNRKENPRRGKGGPLPKNAKFLTLSFIFRLDNLCIHIIFIFFFSVMSCLNCYIDFDTFSFIHRILTYLYICILFMLFFISYRIVLFFLSYFNYFSYVIFMLYNRIISKITSFLTSNNGSYIEPVTKTDE